MTKKSILIGLMTMVAMSCSYKKIEKYESGSIKTIGRITDGKKSGEWVYFKENGDTTEIKKFESGILTSETHFYNNRVFSKNFFRNGNKILQETYYEDGSLECSLNFKADVHHGLSECFYPNGQLKSSHQFRNGVPFGKALEFWQDGLSKLKTDNIGNGIHFFRDSLGNEATHYMIDFKQVDSLEYFSRMP
ncbi:MAG: hypothetical protein RIF46_16830 [Cyclobacteriaceae bacterium]